MKTTANSIKFSKHLFVILLPLICLSFITDASETKKLTAETNHSSLLFSVPISNGITRITGKFNTYTIDLDYTDNDFTKSTLSASIDASSIDTGIEGRDEHLRSADFFETKTYPKITFVSESIEATENSYVAKGNFTMHGVTKDIEIPFRITGIDGENTIGISARFSLDRTDFGVGNEFKHTSIENFISDTIDVEVDFWTKKRKEPKDQK